MSFINFMENFISGFTGGMLFGGRFTFGSSYGISNPFIVGGNRSWGGGYNFGQYNSSCFGTGHNFGNTMDQFNYTQLNYPINSRFNMTSSNFVNTNYSSLNLYSLGGVNNNKIKLPALKFERPASTSSSISLQTSSAPSSPTGKYDINYWKSAYNYDEEDGAWLLNDAKRTSKKDPGQCAGYTRRTLQRKYGLELPSFSARTFEQKIVPKLNGKYKKISIPAGAKFSDFPPGAIFLYFPNGKSSSHFKSDAAKRLGHVSMNGYANGYLELMPDEVWIPVKA